MCLCRGSAALLLRLQRRVDVIAARERVRHTHHVIHARIPGLLRMQHRRESRSRWLIALRSFASRAPGLQAMDQRLHLKVIPDAFHGITHSVMWKRMAHSDACASAALFRLFLERTQMTGNAGLSRRSCGCQFLCAYFAFDIVRIPSTPFQPNTMSSAICTI